MKTIAMSNQPVPFCSQKIGSLIVGEGYSHQGGLRLQCLDKAGNYSSIPDFFTSTWTLMVILKMILVMLIMVMINGDNHE